MPDPVRSEIHRPTSRGRVLLAALLWLGTTYSSLSGAATTGTVNLLSINGPSTQCSFGDWFSANNGSGCAGVGLNTVHQLWIEVPPGTGSLTVQIYDANIEGANDTDLNPPFNTATSYTLYNPAGGQVGTANCNVSTCAGWLPNNTANANWRSISPGLINAPASGLWRLQVSSLGVTAGNDSNGYGLRAFSNDATELNIFYYAGSGGPDTGTHTYTHYPWVTSGCQVGEQNFDFDDGFGYTVSGNLTSRLGNSLTALTNSGNGDWVNNLRTIENQDDSAEDYGIYTLVESLTSFFGTALGNFANWFVYPQGQPATAPGSNFALNDGRAFRTYLGTGSGDTPGGAPVKPYLAQWVRQTSPGNPTRFTVTVRLVNPTTRDLPNGQVDGFIPGTATFVGIRENTGLAAVGFPSYVWLTGVVPAGGSAVLAYDIDLPAVPVAPTVVTGTVGSGNGTRATWDEFSAGSTAYSTGELCSLRVGPSLTLALVSRFEVRNDAGGALVEWDTAAEVGTLGFLLEREDPATGEFTRLHDDMITGLGLEHPQGGSYSFVDDDVATGEEYVYRLVEVEARGTERHYGPFEVTVGDSMNAISPGAPAPMAGGKGATSTLSGGNFSLVPASRPVQSSAGAGVPHALKRGDGQLAATVPFATLSSLGGVAESRAQPVPPGRRIIGTDLKIGIAEDGLYYLSAEDIAAGLNRSWRSVRNRLRRGRYALSHFDNPVAWHPAEDGAGMYFYAEGIDSIYTEENVYLLKPRKGLLMESVDGGAPTPGPELDPFIDTRHVEEDVVAVLTRATPDYWYREGTTHGYVRSYPFELEGVAADGDARLDVELYAMTEGDHAVSFEVNGCPVGTASWNGPLPGDTSFPFSSACLLEGTNTLSLTHGPNTGGPNSIVYFNAFDIAYPRSYTASGDKLAFPVDDATDTVSISGFDSETIHLLDISNPMQPRLIDNPSVDPTSGDLSFIAESDGEFLATGENAVMTPAWWVKDGRSRLRKFGNAADYVVITGYELEDGAKELAGFQRGRGLRTRVVLLDDIYDEFNGGIEDPIAIQRFLDFAWNFWRIAPRYAALVGDGSYDHRNLMGAGDALFPAMLTATPDGLFASDNYYGTIGGEQQIAIGRIPAHDNDELLAYVDKLKAWITGHGSGLVQLMADDDDPAAGAFTTESNSLKAIIPSFNLAPEDIYLKDIYDAGGSLDEARTALFDSLNSGVDMVNYLGHGGTDRIAAEGLATSADVTAIPSLFDNERTPVVNALSCIVNRYELPGVDSLGEELVMKTGGGAVAVWSPTGLSENASAAALNRLLYERIYTHGDTVLGDAIVAALNAFAETPGASWMPRVYTFLGDPSIALEPRARFERKKNKRPRGRNRGG